MKNKRREDRNRGADDSVSMSSVELQRVFHDTYENFFHTHDLVLSGDSILTWWADISHGVSVLRLKQKLPMKTYCGVRFNTSWKVTFRTIFVYSILENTFKEVAHNPLFLSEIDAVIVCLQEFLTKNNYMGGIEIDFLSETPPWQGFASSSAVSVLLGFLIFLITGKLPVEVLMNGWPRLDDPLFEELYLESLEISNCIAKGKSISGASNYAVMVPDVSFPIVYLSQKNNLDHGNDTCEENDVVTGALSAVDKALYIDTLHHFLWIEIPTTEELPLDYGILFTWLDSRFREIESTREHEKNEEGELGIFIAGTIASLEVDEERRTMISRLLSFDKDEAIYKNIDMMNLGILQRFHTLLAHKQNGDSAEAFIETIQKVGLASFSYQKINKLFFAMKHYFHEYQQFEDEDIGILPFNSGKIGGSLLFVMKPGKSRTTLQKVIDQLRNDGHILSFAYSSWRDGISSDGVRLEQYLSKKIYSSYAQAGDVRYSDSLGHSYCSDYDTILTRETDSILLDTIAGRIYIKGNKLTSRDIHSQNTTIDMLRILIERIGEEVSNSRLPVSTYSQNKNEILGKVVLPLRRIVEKYFDREISLTCSWGITEYYLRLEKDESLPIGIIERLQE